MRALGRVLPRTSNLEPRSSNLESRISDFGLRTSDLELRTSNYGPRIYREKGKVRIRLVVSRKFGLCYLVVHSLGSLLLWKVGLGYEEFRTPC